MSAIAKRVSKRELRRRLDAILALHHPGDAPYRTTVVIYCEDYDGCDGDDDAPCEVGEHDEEACQECRQVYEEMDGFLLHPCPTRRIALEGHARGAAS